MKLINLKFYGPVPIIQFINSNPPNSEHPGVYIWGFMQHDKFIPFYVGKSHSTISSRIKQHYKDIIKPDSTYMRYTKSYMEGPNPYYIDNDFPTETYCSNRNKLPGWAKKPTPQYVEDRIVYMNNKAFLENKYKGINLTEASRYYPINLIGNDKYDYLTENMDKLYVMHSAYSSTDYFDFKQSEFFEVLEAFVKYSLRGKTGSKSLSFELLHKKIDGFTIKIDNMENYMGVFKSAPGNEFTGY